MQSKHNAAVSNQENIHLFNQCGILGVEASETID